MVLMKNTKSIDACADSEMRIQRFNQSCIENRMKLERLYQQIERCQDFSIINLLDDYLCQIKNCQIEQ
jgi:hypothetical protein